ncbi:MAG: Rne/Rng family ribonuclease [Actinobacteria bacterium]|nr:Rne/Rng family ribonuclease [Actinomycetota bacterium]
MALKKGRKEMLISSDGGQNRVAILEDDGLVEIYIDKNGRKSIVGNIYRGRISNVLPGMSSAFVDISAGKNALLYFQDLLLMEDGSHLKPRKISKVLNKNDPVVVQVTKDPIKGKGARLTTNISIPGRLMVYIPQGSRSGVSRRLPERERERLRRISKEIRPEEGSIIIRTAAQKARKRDLLEDLEYCKDQWVQVQKKLEKTKHPGVVYTEPDLPVRVIRDNLSRDFGKVLVDSEREYSRIVNYLKTAAPELRDRMERYKGGKPLFTTYGIEEGIEAALRPKVSLPSGGSIVIDEAEALTAIDVNTGSYTGRKSLEETVLKTNMEAVIEVVRQLRLRDIGGIIVIDFIDMEKHDNKAKVLDALEKELEKDRTKTQIVTLSRLGLVEMTRKNVTEGLADTLGRKCPRCEGRGLIFHD